MTTVLWAGAGLSDCVQDDMDCMPGFWAFLVALVLVCLVVVGWAAATLTTTIEICCTRIPWTHRLAWLLAVWFLPLIGPIAWFRRNPGEAEPDTARSAFQGPPRR
ncbi:PLDc_N domain-containing protein [Nocardia farcinica]|uniref:PLD nuclease N-terminal domain-containing protein n=1 Tax=Nocardia farcinica TaxID=37329 RepID=UPI001895DDA6|nr:PLD nuclease N-terminal domain-containing protein [Nocardia farcinica]MBF6362413.1 PLDc_N domain-containing protein [Nocardia farcinica]